MKEADYKRKHLRPFLEGLGFLVKAHTEKFSSGWPDMSAVHKPDGRTIYIEAKVWPSKPTPLQMKMLSELASHGADCYIFTAVPIRSGWSKSWRKVEQFTIQAVRPEGDCFDISQQNFIIRWKESS